MNKEIYNKYN